MKNEDHFKAALKMIKVTPENYKSLNADIIVYLCGVVAEADERCKKPSAYNGLSEEQIKEKTSF
jgi:hypothetical protein